MSHNKGYGVAYSSHSFCFICKWPNKFVKLKEVKISSIKYAYRVHKIIIKLGTRCCEFHLNSSGLIKKDQFSLIPTLALNERKIRLSELEYDNSFDIFDHFEDLYYLDNELCKEITGWSKDKFIEFCNNIKPLNFYQKISKEQLVALYRFWLRKGLDEFILSKMFKKNISQQKISYFLKKIRKAIYEDFVPLFLGSKEQRNFYLKHNTIMATKLHNLNEDELVIIVDGTYCRLQKSANNEFQYSCWSEQKKDLLIKPFLIVCADGWIIDCYGPFKANQNDAKIFEYILNIDEDLRKLLIKDKTVVFMDRAFRDISEKLLNEFGFKVKIPSCNQTNLNNDDSNGFKSLVDQLSVQQTNENRFVTKCRFIVEKEIGNLKRYKALENISNRQASHISIDYRIASAMNNFDHKCVCPDGKNADRIVERLKKKSERKINYLEGLLRKHLRDTNSIKRIFISDMNDFPILTVKKLIRKIFLGTYQLRLSKSYVGDIIKNQIFYEVSDQLLKNIQKKLPKLKNIDTKIIGVEIPSRHRRSIKDEKVNDSSEVVKEFKNKYKVYIHYLPNINKTKSIIGYVCSCRSGKKLAGCCVHVSTVIYYLSYARFTKINIPAEVLNSIFVDLKKKEKPNSPRYIKFPRKLKQNVIESDSESSISNQSIEIDTINDNELVEIERDENKKLSIQEFKRHVPAWGGFLYINKRKINLTNTCTIDYFLLAFWYMSKINQFFIQNLPILDQTESIKQIILSINSLDWNKAKEIWLLEISKINVGKKNKIDLYGTQYDHFIFYLLEYQKHSLIQKCDEKCKMNGINIIRSDSDRIFFKKIRNRVNLYSCYTEKCNNCKKNIKAEIRFINNPNFLMIESAFDNIHVIDLPKEIVIENKIYKLLSVTISTPGHFIGIFDINGLFYEVNDLGQKVSKLNVTENETKLNKESTTVSIYYLG